MHRKIALRCRFCGNAMLLNRLADEPEKAVELVTSECDVCEHASGGFSEDLYYDRQGDLVAECVDVGQEATEAP